MIVRTYMPVGGQSPRPVPASPVQGVAELSPSGERVAVVVPASHAARVADALNSAYQQGRADLAGEAAAVIPEPMLIDQFTAEQVEAIVRAAAALWFYSGTDFPDVLDEGQRGALDLAAKAWWDENHAAMTAGFQPDHPRSACCYPAGCTGCVPA
jgi:hypothetical protein